MKISVLLVPQAAKLNKTNDAVSKRVFTCCFPQNVMAMEGQSGKQAQFLQKDTSGSASMGSSKPAFMASVISIGDILNSISPLPSTCTFVGTQATIAAGRGAVGFPKSEMNSSTLAPVELT